MTTMERIHEILTAPYAGVFDFNSQQLVEMMACHLFLMVCMSSSWVLYHKRQKISPQLRLSLVAVLVVLLLTAPALLKAFGSPLPSPFYCFILSCLAWIISMRTVAVHLGSGRQINHRAHFNPPPPPPSSSSEKVEKDKDEKVAGEQIPAVPVQQTLSWYFWDYLDWALDHLNTPERRQSGWQGRKEGLSRIARGACKIVLYTVLYQAALNYGSALKARAPLALVHFLDFVLLWAAVAGLAEVAWGLFGLLGGYQLPVFFRLPMLATSPMSFWNDRWNRLVHYLLRDSTFRPLRRYCRCPPAVAAFLVFLHSGLAHEYVLYCAFGAVTGEHLLFFCAQTFLCSAEIFALRSPPLLRLLASLPRSFKWLLNTFVMLTVAQLFFAPFSRHNVFFSS